MKVVVHPAPTQMPESIKVAEDYVPEHYIRRRTGTRTRHNTYRYHVS